MPKFKQKMFLAGAVVGNILAGVGIAGTGAQMWQSDSQAKEQAKQMQEQQRMENARNKKMTEALNNLADQAKSNPQAAQQASQVGNIMQQNGGPMTNAQQVSYSDCGGTNIKFHKVRRKLFAAAPGFWGNAKALGGAMWDLTKKRKGLLIGGAVTGVGMAGADYLANKYIQHDMKKSGIVLPTQQQPQQQPQPQRPMQPQQPQRQFSAAETVLDAAELDRRGPQFAKGQHWNNIKTGASYYGKKLGVEGLGFGALFSGIKVVGYHGEKEQLKAMMRQTQKNAAAVPQQAMRPQQVQPMPQQPTMQQPQMQRPVQQQQRNFGWVAGAMNGVHRFWNKFKARPGESILNGASHLMMGGGKSGVTRFGDHLVNYGKTNNNQFLQNAGNWVKNNTKTALAGSIALGAGVTAATWDLGQHIAEKGLKKADPNAYAYDEFKNKQIQ